MHPTYLHEGTSVPFHINETILYKSGVYAWHGNANVPRQPDILTAMGLNPPLNTP